MELESEKTSLKNEEFYSHVTSGRDQYDTAKSREIICDWYEKFASTWQNY